MKLSLIEPFAARPSNDDPEGVEESNKASSGLFVVPQVESGTSEDSCGNHGGNDLSKGLSRFVDFISQQRKRRKKSYYETEAFRFKVIKAYRACMEFDLPSHYRGNNLKIAK